MPGPNADPTAALDALLTPAQAAWLAATCAVADDQTVLRTFPAVGRRLGRAPLTPGGHDDLHTWTVDDAGRARLLQAAGAIDPVGLPNLLNRLYAHGDASERRGVLRSLDLLPLADEGLRLVRDALRTNDLRLIAAAAGGGYAGRRLSDHEFDQAVLKCLFVGVPLAGVTVLPDRTTPRLTQMVADFARERIAAGRAVPPDCLLVLAELEG